MKTGLFLLLGLLFHTHAKAVPCHDPRAHLESIQTQVFQDPAKAMKEARAFFPFQKVRCGLQWALGLYLTESEAPPDAPWMKAVEHADRKGPYASEILLLETLHLEAAGASLPDLQERIRSLEEDSREAPPAVRVLFLYLITAAVHDPLLKASLEGEMEEKLASDPALSAFDRVLLLEYQAYHMERNRNPQKKLALRDSFLAALRSLKLDYWEAFILYNHARTFQRLGTLDGNSSAARYYADAASRFRSLTKDALYASILLGQAGIAHGQGRKAEAIRLAREAEPYFIQSRNRIWQGEVWKRLATFYVDDRRYGEALAAVQKAEALFSTSSESDRNQLEEIEARIRFGMGEYEEAVLLLESFTKNFSRLEEEQRQQYAKEQGARYGLTLEEERNKIRALNQETAQKQALMDTANRKARERSLQVRLFASTIFMLGAVWLVWIIRRGLILGKAIHSLNAHIENHALERFLPPAMVHEVAAGRLQLDERPNTRLVTILAADIVGFTQGTESLGSERIAKILNQFMVTMGNVIFEHQGTIDKFIGDGVLAIFGAPLDMDAETQALQASRCAQAMIKALDGLNQELLPGLGWKLRLRIGMHQGVALVGSFGTRQRSDYGAIGDAVHIASRIQTVAGPNEVLLTTSVKQHLDTSLCFRRGDLKIRQQSQAIAMHSLSLTAELKSA
ncbi:MAG TPA: adenylate/guanylate cyclase domain-containing protein [Oligoflexus sp.]|uniref:adenylate/guanylate cyclase domain-containing protein n=1 Tax=Oligoflexus sp. TaxID=1971216 RepID=UPI002D7EA0D6|nr:adenylate/guanylate cyclase domain-containing protein [Oligoflexus sp.]HET9237617.1 adenylate/guanylate cyclase domain-containing protein [Oligoflexus sp.]